MEDSPAVQLIAVEIQNPEFTTLLNDIRDFNWQSVSKLRKEDIKRIEATGFRFKTKAFESQKMEFKSFLLEHPSVMASDMEMILFKLEAYGRLIATHAQAQKSTQPSQRQQTPIREHHKKSKKPRVIVVESSDYEEEDSEDEYDVEYVPVPHKRSRKAIK